jgi:hypothetical protein
MLTPTVKCFYAVRVLACVSLPLTSVSDVVANSSDQPKHRDGVNADKEHIEGDGIH